MKKFVKTLAPLALAGMLALTTACVQQAEPIAAGPTEYVPVAAQPDITEHVYAVHTGPALLSPEDIDALWSSMFDPETVQIIVKGEVIDAPTPFTCSTAGTIFLPIVAISEALGYLVEDNGSEVIIAPGSIVTEGVNNYFRGREAPMELASAPVMHDETLFVPWEFFHEILSSVAYVEDGNIHVVMQDE